MKKYILMLVLCALAFGCKKAGSGSDSKKKDTPSTVTTIEVPSFAKGADISWVTEMESNGYKFYNQSGKSMECTALMQSIGCNSIRLRVWVDPSDGWCNKADVLVKAKRARDLGMALMIDFHYSDSWADPSKQTIPSAWDGMNVTQMAKALSEHTTDVLQTLKDALVDVAWVQIGNETNTGMCWEVGSVSSSSAAGFIALANAGYKAVKAVYPEALVLLHHSSAEDLSGNTWFFNLVKSVSFDMIGLSLYPSYWDSSSQSYPDWTTKTSAALANFKTLYETYNKPIMLVEFGMPVSQPANAKAALQYLMDGTKDYSWFKGIFYWEPESESARNNYDYGAFSGGKPTIALDPFAE